MMAKMTLTMSERPQGVGKLLALSLFAALIAALPVHGQTYTVLYTFTGTPDGAKPDATPILDSAGNLYGTTFEGGAYGYGTIFKLDTTGTETVLYSFAGPPDGSYPAASGPGLTPDRTGNLYGTTFYGGAYGDGTVFKFDKAGAETVLHSFGGAAPDGVNPLSPLVVDGAGNIFGVTTDAVRGEGTVFEVNAEGNESILHTFLGRGDGVLPDGGLVQSATGNLYGVTYQGGLYEFGTVFEVNPTTRKETVLASLGATEATGWFPEYSLIQDGAGNLYGSAQGGLRKGPGCGPNGCGIVFKIGATGGETVLYTFPGGSNGADPLGGLVRDASGNIYGIAGSYNGDGLIFKIDPAGRETPLHRFSGGADGAYPSGGLVLDSAGNLYGTTFGGGDLDCYPLYGGCGVIFKLSLR